MIVDIMNIYIWIYYLNIVYEVLKCVLRNFGDNLGQKFWVGVIGGSRGYVDFWWEFKVLCYFM